MTAQKSGKQLDEQQYTCDEEIQLQNNLFAHLLSVTEQVYDDIGDMADRFFEYELFLIEYDSVLKGIQEEREAQKKLQAEIEVLKQELLSSTFEEEMKAHVMLESLLDQKTSKLAKKFEKRLNKAQFEYFQEVKDQLKEEKKNNIRCRKLSEELESLRLENRELAVMNEQKMKRHEMLKETYDGVKQRREKLLKQKEEFEKQLAELEKELEDSEKEDTTSNYESSEDEFKII